MIEVVKDPAHAVSGFLAKHGIAGLLALSKEYTPEVYEMATKQGHKQIDQHVSALFEGKSHPKRDYEHHKNHVDDWLEKGGITSEIQAAHHDQQLPQMFAEGGEVKKPHHKHDVADVLHQSALAESHPDDHMMLQMAKGRIGGYLNSQRPQKHMPKLAFDTEPDQTQQKKNYARARDMAIHPMSLLEHAQRGTLEPEHLKHFNAMYPELGDSIQKKLTEKVIESQLKGHKPSYKARQGLSQLLGTPLSGEMTPQNMQAAQAVFAPKQPPQALGQGEAQKPVKKTSALTKSDNSFLTGNQSLVARQQKNS